jgi:hypothetical protein
MSNGPPNALALGEQEVSAQLIEKSRHAHVCFFSEDLGIRIHPIGRFQMSAAAPQAFAFRVADSVGNWIGSSTD